MNLRSWNCRCVSTRASRRLRTAKRLPNVLWVFSFLVNRAESPKAVTGQPRRSEALERPLREHAGLPEATYGQKITECSMGVLIPGQPGRESQSCHRVVTNLAPAASQAKGRR